MADQTLTATLKFVMDDDGATGVRDLAGNVKMLASAAENAELRAKRMGQEFAKSASGASVPLWGNPGRRGSLGEEVRAAKEKAREEREYEKTLDRSVRSLELQKRLKNDLARMGYGGSAGKAFETMVGGAGLGGSPLGTLARGFGGGGGAFAGATGRAAVEAAHVGMEYYGNLAHIDATPFMSDRARQEAAFRATPVFGGIYGEAVDAGRYFTGESKYQRGIAERDAFSSSRVNKSISEMRFRAFDVTEADAARERSTRVGGISPVEPKGYDRSSVLGKRLYEEELRTLPHQQDLRKAIAERAAAEHKAATYTKLLTDVDSPILMRERELRDRDSQLEIGIAKAGQKGGEQAEGSVAHDLHSQRKEVRDELEKIDDMKQEIAERAKSARVEAIGLSDQEKQARIRANAQSEYDKAVNREARVEGQAERLGRMGMSERMMGEQAARFVQMNKGNLDMLPDEIKQRAERYAPEMMQKLYKDQGEQHLGRAGTVSDEYDQPSRRQARENTDAAAKTLREEQVKVAGETATAYGNALKEFIEILAPLLKQKNQDAEIQIKNLMQLEATKGAASTNRPRTG